MFVSLLSVYYTFVCVCVCACVRTHAFVKYYCFKIILRLKWNLPINSLLKSQVLRTTEEIFCLPCVNMTINTQIYMCMYLNIFILYMFIVACKNTDIILSAFYFNVGNKIFSVSYRSLLFTIDK